MKTLISTSIIAISLFLTGCGNSWEVTKKTYNSDFGDLERYVKVYDSRTKEVLWTYTGPIYVSDSSTVGDITLVYKDKQGKLRKNDFLGENISLIMFEVVDNAANPSEKK